LRSLQHRLGSVWAVIVQAAIFGACHANPTYGVRNIAVILSITAVGIVLGITAHRYRRLGPGMIAHGLFNLVPLIPLLPPPPPPRRRARGPSGRGPAPGARGAGPTPPARPEPAATRVGRRRRTSGRPGGIPVVLAPAARRMTGS